MNILIVSPYFTPYENPRAYRWTQIAKYLNEHGHTVHVITANDHQLGSEFQEFYIHRIGHSTPDKIFLSDKSAQRGAWIPDILKRKIKRHLWPDESRTWIRPALLKATQVCSEHHINLIISVSLPFSSHCIGHELKKRFSLPWLADVGDPFELGKNDLKSSSRVEREKDILNHSDIITVTNHSLAVIYKSTLRNHSQSVAIVGPMSSPLIGNTPVQHQRQAKAPLKFGYFGTFYRNVREPEILIEGINLLVKNWSKTEVELHLYGDIKSHFLNQIQTQLSSARVRLISHSNIARSEVIKTMRDFDVLLSVGNKSINQIPSKVIDYVISLRPILHFSYVSKDTVVDYLEANPLFVQFNSDDVDSTKINLIELIDEYQIHEHDHYKSVLQNSRPSSIGEQYNQLIKSMTS